MIETHRGRDALLFLLPIGVVYAVFLVGPIFGSFFLSMSSYDIIRPPRFVGFENFVRLVQSERSRTIFLNTFRITLILIVLHASIGFMLALLVTSLHRLVQGIMRTIIYLPVILTTASMAIAWVFLLNREFGVFNWVLGSLFRLEPIAWLTSSRYVFSTISIFSVWKFIGNSFMYYYIGLMSIPKDYFEAAYIDGAGAFARFRYITLPLMTPTIFFVVMVLCIQTIQIFDEPFFLTRGGPGDASRTINLYIYETAFRNYDLGFASAISISLLVLLVIFTIFQLKFSTLWVTYER